MNKLISYPMVMAFYFLNAKSALGHAPMDYTTMKPRNQVTNSKTILTGVDPASMVPCGSNDAANTPGNVQHVIKTGGTFEVVWVETINHQSKYLIDLISQDAVNDPLNAGTPVNVVLHNQDDFFDDTVFPAANEKLDKDSPNVPGYAGNTVGVDPNAVYRVTVEIPADVNCTKCTLRLMQKMYGILDPDNPTISNTVYSHCTDVEINAVGPVDPPTPAATAPSVPTGLSIEITPKAATN
ncbi:MAG: hypothetical protein AB8G05_25790 [Oligoflexales bacterium]